MAVIRLELFVIGCVVTVCVVVKFPVAGALVPVHSCPPYIGVVVEVPVIVGCVVVVVIVVSSSKR